MTIPKQQSKLRALRDQLSLDYASGKYLNNISANLGLLRPKFGFSDDTWRALVKTLALQPKQVRDKFADVLEILLGPRKSLGLTLAATAAVGAKKITLNSTTGLPQIGRLTLDKGLVGLEETVDYYFVDYSTNTVYLSTALTISHIYHPNDFECDLLLSSAVGATTLYVTDLNGVTPFTPAPFLLDPGTDREEVVNVLVTDPNTGIVTLVNPTVYAHDGITPNPVITTLTYDYLNNSEILVLGDVKKIPSSGYLLVGPSSSTVAATGGSTTTFVTSANTFTANKHVGNIAVFEGNVTPALAGVEATIIGNTDSTLTFAASIGTAPAALDRITIKQRVKYTSVSISDNSVILKNPLYDVSYAATTKVELLGVKATFKLAGVYVENGCWDIYQVSPREVEIFICPDKKDISNLFSASYLHREAAAPILATLLSPVSIGATSLSVSNLATAPIVGVLTLNGVQRVPYKKRLITDTVAVSTTNSVIQLTTGGLTASALIGQQVQVGDYFGLITANTASTITIDGQIPDYILSTFVVGTTPVKFYSEHIIDLLNGTTVLNNLLAGVSVDLYEPTLVGSLPSGDLWTTQDVFPGPYLYDNTDQAPSVITTTTTTAIPPISKLMLDVAAGATAIEVEDATLYDLVNFPYTVQLGSQSANKERVTVFDVNLAQRSITTLSSGVSPGALTLPVAALSLGGAGDAAGFPNANGYRVRLGVDTASEEVVYVTGTLTGPNRLVLNTPVVNSHLLGATVALYSDVLTVDTLLYPHVGITPYMERNYLFPQTTSTLISLADIVGYELSGLDVTSSVGFPSKGQVILNFGSENLNRESGFFSVTSSGATTITVTDITVFPTATPYEVILGKGTPFEERAIVTSINTGMSQFTINGGTYGTKYSHPAYAVIEIPVGTKEVVEYTSVVGNSLRFSTPTVLQSIHQKSESVVYSPGYSNSRTSGYDFPLRMPPSLIDRIKYVFELVRAAGVKVTVISSR